MFFIETDRLRLIPLSNHFLKLWQIDRKSMELALHLNPSSMIIDPLYLAEIEDAMINFWLPKTEEHPEDYKWFTNWEIVVKSTNTSIGGIGVGYPDENGHSETGFMLDKQHYGKGFASEALHAMINWAFCNESVKQIVAKTHDDNFSTQKLLERTGFVKTGSEGALLIYQKNRPDN